MSQKSSSVISLGILWFLVAIVSHSIGMAYSFNMIQSHRATWDHYFLAGLVFSEFLSSLGQWRLLKTRLDLNWWWIPANTFGLPLGLFFGHYLMAGLALLVPVPVESWVDFAYMVYVVGVGGTVLGIAQWLMLKNKVGYAYWWILTSGPSWFAGLYLSYRMLNLLNPSSWNYVWAISGVIFGALLGCFIGMIGGITIGTMVTATKRFAGLAAIESPG